MGDAKGHHIADLERAVLGDLDMGVLVVDGHDRMAVGDSPRLSAIARAIPLERHRQVVIIGKIALAGRQDQAFGLGSRLNIGPYF